jgi:hypothetical protein
MLRIICAIAQTAVLSAEILELFGALGQGRRVPAGVGERVQDEPVDPFGPHHRKGSRAQRAGGFAHEMHSGLAGLADHELGRGDEIGDAAGDVGIA